MTNLKEEAAEHLLSELRVVDLGVKLDAVKATRLVGDADVRARIGMRDELEALRHALHIVAVAHPGHALFGDALEKRAGGIKICNSFAILARGIILRLGYFAAERVGDELTAVADAENRHSEPEKLRVSLRTARKIHAVRPAGEDYADGRVLLDFFKRCGVRHHLAVNSRLAHSASDELVVLTSEIEDDYIFSHSSASFLIFLL